MRTNLCGDINRRITEIKKRIAAAAEKSGRRQEDIQLMAVTKNVPAHRVNQALEAGVSLLGENRAQEFLQKREEYRTTLDNIHFIGHLQKNKVRSIIDKVGMIESVDSFSLAEVISKEAGKKGNVMPILLEVNIGKEETKSGYLPETVSTAIQDVLQLPHLRLCGLMCIPPKNNTSYYFQKMFEIYLDNLIQNVDNKNSMYLSMGMSGDFEEAIQYGANLVRLGKAIFEI